MCSVERCRQGLDEWPKGLSRFIGWCLGLGLVLGVGIWTHWYWWLRPIEMALYYEDVALTALGNPELVLKWQKEGRIPISLRSNEEAFRYFAARSLEYDRGAHTKILLHLAFLAALRNNEVDAEFFYTLFCAERNCDVGYTDWRRGVETLQTDQREPSVEKLKGEKDNVSRQAP